MHKFKHSQYFGTFEGSTSMHEQWYHKSQMSQAIISLSNRAGRLHTQESPILRIPLLGLGIQSSVVDSILGNAFIMPDERQSVRRDLMFSWENVASSGLHPKQTSTAYAVANNPQSVKLICCWTDRHLICNTEFSAKLAYRQAICVTAST